MNKKTHTRGTRKNAPERYLKFLQELEQVTKTPVNFSMIELIKKHKISSSVRSVLIEAGIIEKVNGLYEWKSIKPNIKMASKVVSTVSKNIRESAGNRKNRMIIESKSITPIDLFTPSKEFIPEPRIPAYKPKRKRRMAKIQKTISLFWGLITIKF